MEISSRFVGSALKPLIHPITWRHMMNYAAAIGDVNPAYFDDEQPRGIIAHPMFPVAVTWPISERVWEYIEAEDFPKETLATQVHYTEHLRIDRPVAPGDVITVNGTIAAISPHRAGTVVVLRFAAFDEEGSPVFVEHIGGLMRGVRCTDEGRGREQLPRVPLCPGEKDPFWEVPVPIDRTTPFVYDGCANIYFPIHTSLSFAHSVGLPDIILQGTATLAYAVRELIDREAGGNPLPAKQIACRFTGMVIPPSTIRVRLVDRKVTEDGTDLFFSVHNGEGKRAISDGYVFLGQI